MGIEGLKPLGGFHKWRQHPKGEGVREMLTLLNKISKIADKGEGVQKVQKYADVICESP